MHLESTHRERGLTSLIRIASAGDRAALDRLFRRIEPDLRRMVGLAPRLARGAADMQTTEIIDEGFMRLMRRDGDRWADREHFLRTARLIVRDVIVDSARRNLSVKRGGRSRGGEIDASQIAGDMRGEQGVRALEMAELASALELLRERRPECSDVLWCRFAMRLDRASTAALLGISVHAVDRHALMAKSWLRARLLGREGEEDAQRRADVPGREAGSDDREPDREDPRRGLATPMRTNTKQGRAGRLRRASSTERGPHDHHRHSR